MLATTKLFWWKVMKDY